MATYGGFDFSPNFSEPSKKYLCEKFKDVDIQKVMEKAVVTEKSVLQVLQYMDGSPEIANHLIYHQVTDDMVVGWIFAEMFWMVQNVGR